MSLAARLVILSPHLDDGVFSFGASAARLVRSGAQVESLTVLSGRLDSTALPSAWDRDCGFGSAAEAARTRRIEDEQAWRILGVRPDWLELDGHEPDDVIAEQIASRLANDRLVLVPGLPLVHPDHQRVRRLASESLGHASLGEYVEQPYELQESLRSLMRGRLLRRGSEWLTVRVTHRDRVLKRRAIHAYASQLRLFGPSLGERILLWERLVGGERARLLVPQTRLPPDVSVTPQQMRVIPRG
jgi:LmbE family N-acetylglucosaminyl deacetylase